MPTSAHLLSLVSLSTAAPPSTPLGPFEDSAVTWTTWVTLMGFVGMTALALLCAGPAARRVGADTLAAVTTRLARAAVVLGILAAPAVLTSLAHSGKKGGYNYTAAWNSLYDGSNDGLLSGLEVTFILLGVVAVAPLAVRGLGLGLSAGPARRTLLVAGLVAGSVALGTTKFPDAAPANWGRTVFETIVWMLHLLGGAVWLGGVAGLALLSAPGAIAPADRQAFWARTIRRFSATAMSCVAAVALSGVFLYWEHVDGPTQLFTTMYGRVLGVKILIFGTLLLLGAANQFWLHPRIDAMRAAGDHRPLRTILVRHFPAVVAVETLLGMSVVFVAPFLHGSARNQAFQAAAAAHATGALGKLPKIPAKQVTASTWALGTLETVAVIAVMVGGYWLSGYLARRRTAAGLGNLAEA